MPGTAIVTDKAAGAIGPYSQAMKLGNLVFASGQIALKPATGKLVEGDVSAQTDQLMTNLKAILDASGSSIGQIVKTTCFLTDIGTFTQFNEVYARHMGDNQPARSTVQVAGLPAGAQVEVECIAECD